MSIAAAHRMRGERSGLAEALALSHGLCPTGHRSGGGLFSRACAGCGRDVAAHVPDSVACAVAEVRPRAFGGGGPWP